MSKPVVKRVFAVGDRVKVVDQTTCSHKAPIGYEGVVRHYVPIDRFGYAIEFDKEFENGHECRWLDTAHTPSRRGQWIEAQDLILVASDAVSETPVSTLLPTDASARKAIPIVSGAFDYFPAALAEVAKLSKVANDQHNPGEPMHWCRTKSTDHADCIGRHLAERGTIDTDGQRHSTKIAWRALALLQMELEAEGAPVARGAR